jgi:hypothetical protein
LKVTSEVFARRPHILVQAAARSFSSFVLAIEELRAAREESTTTAQTRGERGAGAAFAAAHRVNRSAAVGADHVLRIQEQFSPYARRTSGCLKDGGRQVNRV